MKKLLPFVLILIMLSTFFPAGVFAQAAAAAPAAAAPRAGAGGAASLPIPFVDFNVRTARNNQEVVLSVQLLLLLTVLALAPSILILTTCFLRIAIVFDFIKRALSLQSAPPNQVMMGLALFLTLFIMWPTFNQIYETLPETLRRRKDRAAGDVHQRGEAAAHLHVPPDGQRRTDSIRLFMSMRGLPKPQTLADVPTYVLIPAFVIHEMTVAFKIGILLFIPFIIIDMVVASTLMSMGMIMLPPVMISMPFKLILFVLVDGWGLLTMQLVRSFK